MNWYWIILFVMFYIILGRVIARFIDDYDNEFYGPYEFLIILFWPIVLFWKFIVLISNKIYNLFSYLYESINK